MVDPIRQVGWVPPKSIASPSAEPNGDEFRRLLLEGVGKIEQLRADAAGSIEGLLSGGSEELHTVALATQRAELAFELGLQIRNKVVQAYQEIMRMQM